MQRYFVRDYVYIVKQSNTVKYTVAGNNKQIRQTLMTITVLTYTLSRLKYFNTTKLTCTHCVIY